LLRSRRWNPKRDADERSSNRAASTLSVDEPFWWNFCGWGGESHVLRRIARDSRRGRRSGVHMLTMPRDPEPPVPGSWIGTCPAAGTDPLPLLTICRYKQIYSHRRRVRNTEKSQPMWTTVSWSPKTRFVSLIHRQSKNKD
jgi:hypothetical protein